MTKASYPGASDISDALIAAHSFPYEIGKLSITQIRGLIKLIPKKETDFKNLKQWRLLSSRKVNRK